MKTPKLCRNPDGRAYSNVPGQRGKRAYFGTFGTPEAEEAYKKWLVQLLTLPPDAPPPVVEKDKRKWTITRLCEEFLDHSKQQYGEESSEFVTIMVTCRRLFAQAGDELAVTIGPQTFKTFTDNMLKDTYDKGDGVPRKFGRTYINACLSRIKRMVRWACEMEYLPAEVWYKCSVVRMLKKGRSSAPEPRKRRAVSWQTVTETLPFLTQPFRDVAQVQWYCGMRPSEALNMRDEEMNTKAPVWLYSPLEHKGTYREIELTKAVPRPAQAILEPRRGHPSGFLFPCQSWKPARESSYYHAVRRACEKARKAGKDVSDWAPNQLRHGIATLIREKYGIDSSQIYLGHSDPDVTAIYAERTVSSLVSLAERLDAEVFPTLAESLPHAPSSETGPADSDPSPI